MEAARHYPRASYSFVVFYCRDRWVRSGICCASSLHQPSLPPLIRHIGPCPLWVRPVPRPRSLALLLRVGMIVPAVLLVNVPCGVSVPPPFFRLAVVPSDMLVAGPFARIRAEVTGLLLLAVDIVHLPHKRAGRGRAELLAASVAGAIQGAAVIGVASDAHEGATSSFARHTCTHFSRVHPIFRAVEGCGTPADM